MLLIDARDSGPTARAVRARIGPALMMVVAGCMVTSPPAAAENWRLTASTSATATYTTNVNTSSSDQRTGDFATTMSAGLNIRGEGARVQLNGSVGASWLLYATETRNNTIAPTVNLSAKVEAIEKFAFVEASVSVTQSFLSPFAPQPDNLVNATSNRYTSQTYTVSPYIKGVLGSTNIAYQVRDDNTWTAASSFGDSSNSVPNTYSNRLSASLSSGASPIGWQAGYDRAYYDNGVPDANTTTQIARLILSYQVDPQVQVSARMGYEDNQFPGGTQQGTVYGAGLQWSPTQRTQVGGFWEHRFFGSSFDWSVSHRLPNASIRAGFSRGLSSYPQLALTLPAGAVVSQFVDAAFTTRIPDPAERARAVDEFLARTALPPTLVTPVNFYATTVQLQNSQNVSLVLIGVRNTITFTVFNVRSETVAGTGSELPSAFQFPQNNTQTGVGAGYSQPLTGFTSFGANASYSRARANGDSSNDFRSNNGNFGANLSTRFGPKTSGSAGLSYSLFRPAGGDNARSSDTLNIFASISHTF